MDVPLVLIQINFVPNIYKNKLSIDSLGLYFLLSYKPQSDLEVNTDKHSKADNIQSNINLLWWIKFCWNKVSTPSVTPELATMCRLLQSPAATAAGAGGSALPLISSIQGNSSSRILVYKCDTHLLEVGQSHAV